MKYIFLLILSLLSFSLLAQEKKPEKKAREMFRQSISSYNRQAANMNFVRLSQYGYNNKTIIKTKGKDISVDTYQYGKNNLIDFDIYGKNTYNDISQKGSKNTIKVKGTLYNNDLSLSQYGKNNLIEFRNNKFIPGMKVSQTGKGVKVIFY